MIIFELLYLDSPYSECENSYQISELILSNTPPEEPFSLPEEYLPFSQLYKACTLFKPISRPNSQELLTATASLPSNKEESLAKFKKSKPTRKSKESPSSPKHSHG